MIDPTRDPPAADAPDEDAPDPLAEAYAAVEREHADLRDRCLWVREMMTAFAPLTADPDPGLRQRAELMVRQLDRVRRLLSVRRHEVAGRMWRH